MSGTTSGEAVRFEVTVAAPVERAFRVFTEQFDRIKPREHNLLAPEAIAETVFEARVGGHVYDRGENGSVCRWARVLAFDPPTRFVISWDISPTWQVVTDPAEASEVEVRFVADGPDRTRVELEHRHLERHGAGWESVREGVDGPQGWPVYLERYVAVLAG
ncbi:SRPBCC family protein [Nocardioides sp. LHD-245]|uniref:SRPBCC family protein n=1 Tax=Nocardioides sp. LHD-245 TaxID=3051387 RepID=UPI0027E0F53E|nr:SRPBCC family protein [Nocardioides sp. LHD-245]